MNGHAFNLLTSIEKCTMANKYFSYRLVVLSIKQKGKTKFLAANALKGFICKFSSSDDLRISGMQYFLCIFTSIFD